MLRTLRALTRNKALERTIAKVLAVDELAVAADLELAGGTVLSGVPLRVLNSDGDAGIYAYPAVGSHVKLEFVGGSAAQPRVAQVQDFDRLVMRKPDGFTLEMTRDGRVLVGYEGEATHPMVQGDVLFELATAFKSYVDTHKHGGVSTGAGQTGAPTTTSPEITDFKSARGFIE